MRDLCGLLELMSRDEDVATSAGKAEKNLVSLLKFHQEEIGLHQAERMGKEKKAEERKE